MMQTGSMSAAVNGDFEYDDESLEELQAAWDQGIPVTTGRLPSVLDIAEVLLERLPGDVDGLKLEKLCYLVQAEHLASTGLVAFSEPIEAWINGPVVDRLYQKHKHKQRSAITTVGGDTSVVTDPVLLEIIEAVVLEYGHWTGPQLWTLTHNQAPWLDAREGLGPKERSRTPIPPGAMREFFARVDAAVDGDSRDD
jgi:uncharacterized phage-associated protein